MNSNFESKFVKIFHFLRLEEDLFKILHFCLLSCFMRLNITITEAMRRRKKVFLALTFSLDLPINGIFSVFTNSLELLQDSPLLDITINL